MQERPDEGSDRVSRPLDHGCITRRDFLRRAGALGAVLGWGTGMGALLGACGDDDDATTSATALVKTTGGNLPQTTTTVEVDPERGRDIVVGLVSPTTGHLALYGKADAWWMEFATRAVPDGIIGGDGKRHRMIVRPVDSGSDRARAAMAATELLADDGVDLMMASGNSETVTAVADRCESAGRPGVFNLVHWQPFFGPGVTVYRPSRWAYVQALDLQTVAAEYIAMWDQVETNKKVGFLFADETSGAYWSDPATGLPAAAEAAGYAPVIPALSAAPEEDYAELISGLKSNGCEICCVVAPRPPLALFWKQALAEGYRPKVLTARGALLFPHDLAIMGAGAHNTTTECVWHPSWPFHDSITGKSCQELAEDFMAKTGEQWISPIAQYARFEWAVDVFRRVVDLDDKYDVVDKIRHSRLDTCLGRIDFAAPVREGTRHPVERVYLSPIGGQQWVKGDSSAFTPVVVSNASARAIRPTATVLPMEYEEPTGSAASEEQTAPSPETPPAEEASLPAEVEG